MSTDPVLEKAFNNAQLLLDMTLTTPSDEHKIYFIRLYKALSSTMGDNLENMIHWLNTYNRAFVSTPREKVQSIEGIELVVEYLEFTLQKP